MIAAFPSQQAVLGGRRGIQAALIPSPWSIWTERDAANDNDFMGITFGDKFVAVADSNNDGQQVMTSPDGLVWTGRDAADVSAWTAVAWNGSAYCAVTQFVDYCMTSPTGATWTKRTGFGLGETWSAICRGASSRFIAVAALDFALGQVNYSDDNGATWTQVTCPAGEWHGVAFGNNIVVAVGADNTAMYSDDNGETWTASTPSVVGQWNAVAYGNGLFVAVSATGAVMTSPTGVTWTTRTAGAASGWTAIAFGQGANGGAGLFAAVAGSGASRAMTSPDGINWTPHTTPLQAWASVAYGAGLFVATSETESGKTMTAPGN